MLLYEKRDQLKLNWSKSLSFNLYKLLEKIITNRLLNKFDKYQHQPLQEVGFRKECTTIDHIETMRTLPEKSLDSVGL